MDELDRTSFREFRERITRYEEEAPELAPRTYPGYPRVALEKPRARRLVSLDRALLARRSARELGKKQPSKKDLARVLAFAHGVHADEGRGPVPSAGGLQALELYVAVLEEGWLERAVHHYDRRAHALSKIAPTTRAEWEARTPSLAIFQGGSLLWLIVGDGARVRAKYGDRTERFLLLEAGHLMQNLCVLGASLGIPTVPLGGFLEREVARALQLLETDLVLYAGIC